MEVTHNQLVTDDIEELKAQLAALKAENDALRSRVVFKRIQISKKRAVSVYGINSVPVTLYGNQWLKLLDMAEEIRLFVKNNEGDLSMERPEDYKTLGQEAKERGDKHLAGAMYSRLAGTERSLHELIKQREAELAEKKAKQPEDVAPTQSSLPGLAATPVVQKESAKSRK